MSRKKLDTREVMVREITAALKHVESTAGKLDELLKLDSTGWPAGWVAGLHDRRMDTRVTQVYLRGWLDSINQGR